jgi:hypothetical protein
MATNYQELEKIINTKQIFADLAYKEYRASKYGMTFCCPTNFSNHTNVNEICDWEESSKTLYNESTYTFTTWNWGDWITNGNGEPPNWVRTIMPENLVDQYPPHHWVYRMTPQRSSKTYQLWSNMQYEIPYALASQGAALNAGVDMDLALTGAQVDKLVDSNGAVRNTSRIYIMGFQNDDQDWAMLAAAPNIPDTDVSKNMVKKSMKEKVRLPAGATLGVNRNIQRLPLISDMYILNNTAGQQVIPAVAGTGMNLWCRGNTNGPDQLKNGAVKSDRIFMVLDVKGDWSEWLYIIESAGPDDAANKFYAGYPYAIFEPALQALGADAASGFVSTGIKPRLSDTTATSSDNIARASTHYINTEYVGDEFYVDYDATKDKAMLSFGRCTTDAEEIIIVVKDKNGAVVKNYDVMVDNTYYGKTDASGILILTILNASVDTKHIINGCKCFTTTGGCNQQKIDIVLSDEVTPVCTNLAIDCL